MSRRRSSIVYVAVLVSVSACLALGQARSSPRSRIQPFAAAVERTFREGVNAKLPPHISTLLGISQEKECAVKQGVERAGATVRGIDVSVANKHDVVLFVVDEAAKEQTLYLTSRDGRLRKVVSVKAGEGRVTPITGENRKAFEDEKQFWVERLAATKVPR